MGGAGAAAAAALAGWTTARLAAAYHRRGDLLRAARWCAWRMLPACFPPRQTVYGWFAAFRDAGVWEAVNHYLVVFDRERAGCEASPSAAVIDSQSTKTTEA